MTINDAPDPAVAGRIAHIAQEHADLSAAIDALAATPVADQLQLARLKKRKLMLKDQLTLLQDQIIPDIIA